MESLTGLKKRFMKSNVYKIVIQYKGTNYFGWQVQKKERTIQGVLNSTLRKIAQSDQIKTLATGRTDAKVHALVQIVRVDLPIKIPAEALLRALNSLLPDDIRILKAEKSDSDFSPITNAKKKEYHYIFTNNQSLSAFQADLYTNFPYELDYSLMNEAAQFLVGERDFINYFCKGSNTTTTVREIFEAEVLHKENSNEYLGLQDYYLFRIKGSGFLKQMVRLLTGALIEVGRRRVSLAEFKSSFTQQLPKKLGPTAPPEGLYLYSVELE